MRSPSGNGDNLSIQIVDISILIFSPGVDFQIINTTETRGLDFPFGNFPGDLYHSEQAQYFSFKIRWCKLLSVNSYRPKNVQLIQLGNMVYKITANQSFKKVTAEFGYFLLRFSIYFFKSSKRFLSTLLTNASHPFICSI
jgi:hypothetical protein